MVNNFDRIRDIIKFDVPNCCYVVQILSRKKDGEHDGKSGEYLIRTLPQFDSLRQEIIEKCNAKGARAYINLNRRDIRKANLELVSRLMTDEIKGECVPASVRYSSVLGKNIGPDKLRTVDVDGIPTDSAEMHEIIRIIQASEHSEEDPVIAAIPSNTGFHVISRGFNPVNMRAAYPQVMIMQDAMTNLYIP